MPTITNAAQVTGEVNSPNINGAKNIENKNSKPVTIAVRPVLPPFPIPAALSTNAVTVLVPTIAPTTPPTASARNAFSIPTAWPSSSMNPHCLPKLIRVPVVSKNVTNINENMIIIKLGMFENSCPNPLINPKNNDTSKLTDMICSGKEGINALPVPNPHAVKITPIMAATINPRNTAAGIFFTYKTNVMIMPNNARSAGGVKRDPMRTIVDGSETIIPAPFNPKNARKNPMAAPIPNFKSRGMAFRIASLKPEMVIIKKIMLERNTAARAVSQVFPIDNIIVYVNSAFNPMPGANPIGYLATNPIIKQATQEDTAVAKNTPVAGIPPSDKTTGFTPKI